MLQPYNQRINNTEKTNYILQRICLSDSFMSFYAVCALTGFVSAGRGVKCALVQCTVVLKLIEWLLIMLE
jgi:hypothetical protein